MSWGELTCEKYGDCKHNPTIKTCNTKCGGYIQKECFDVQAAKDGLWLHCPALNGVKTSINLLQPDKYRLTQMLEELWRDMRGITPPIK